MRIYLILLLPFLSASCVSQAPKPNTFSIETAVLKNPPAVGISAKGQKIFLGGFSALEFIKKIDSRYYFSTITDRGANAEEIELTINSKTENFRPFVLPQYAPQLVELSYEALSGEFKVESMQDFNSAPLKKMTGLPPAQSTVTARVEKSIDLNGHIIKTRPGMDSEGLCRIGEDYLVSDEYGPNLFHFDKSLTQTKKWEPSLGLPAEISYREINRGFEGLACDGKYAYLMLQSPLRTGREVDRTHTRLIKFDPATGKTVGEYYYAVSPQRADKIGDIAFAGGQKFLVIEQNGKLGSKKGVREVYEVNLEKHNEKFILEKKLIVDLNSLGFDYVEKIEGIAVINEHSFALITDNDFGLAGGFNVKNGKVAFKDDPKSYLVIIHY